MAGSKRKALAPIDLAQSRERQLDLLTTTLVLALLFTVGMLVYVLSSSDTVLVGAIPLEDFLTRTLLAAFALMLLIYVADQRRRLRAQVARAMREAEDARAALHTTVGWLTFSHQAASVLGREGVEAGLMRVLTGAAELYGADAAAVVGDHLDSAYMSDTVLRDQAQCALLHIAIAAAGRAEPLLIESLGVEEGQAIAVPLRVSDELRYVLCMWNRDHEFQPQQLESLGLMGRMIELAMEREESLEEARSQLEGTLSVLQYLVSDKRPDYSQHAIRVSDLASTIGRRLGMPVAERKALRLAGLLHDVGIMTLPHDFADAAQPLTREQRHMMQQHPRISAEIARVARFGEDVQEAIAAHHERLDGSGYPNGLHGDEIPLSARILAVCEVFDSMTNRTYHGSPATLGDAVGELRGNTGLLYDRLVVEALLEELPPQEEVVMPDLRLDVLGVVEG